MGSGLTVDRDASTATHSARKKIDSPLYDRYHDATIAHRYVKDAV